MLTSLASRYYNLAKMNGDTSKAHDCIDQLEGMLPSRILDEFCKFATFDIDELPMIGNAPLVQLRTIPKPKELLR